MRPTNIKNLFHKTRMLLTVLAAVASLGMTAHAAAPGILGPTFNLTAQPAYLTQPDGQSIYSWGYGCNSAPAGFAPIAIGFALVLFHLVAIPITNASLNPARSTATAIFGGAIAQASLWLYWVAPIAGGIIGGGIGRWLHVAYRSGPTNP